MERGSNRKKFTQSCQFSLSVATLRNITVSTTDLGLSPGSTPSLTDMITERELLVKRILDYLFWYCVACCCALCMVSVVETFSKLKSGTAAGAIVFSFDYAQTEQKCRC